AFADLGGQSNGLPESLSSGQVGQGDATGAKQTKDETAGNTAVFGRHHDTHRDSIAPVSKKAGNTDIVDLLAPRSSPKTGQQAPGFSMLRYEDDTQSTAILGLAIGPGGPASVQTTGAANPDASVAQLAQTPLWRDLNEVEKQMDATQDEGSLTIGTATGVSALLSLG